MRPRPHHPVIHKFGGAALKDGDSIRRARDIFQQHTGPRVMVVSAIAGTTDHLLQLVTVALRGELDTALAGVAQFDAQHRQVVAELSLGGSVGLLDQMAQATTELEQLLRAAAKTKDISPAIRDLAVSRGERLSASILTHLLNSSGTDAVLIDPTALIITDGPHGDAVPNQAATRIAAQEHLIPVLLQDKVPVVPGFLGGAPDGSIATLGRGGTDLTATLLARAIDAEHVILWKDVPGLMTADPRVVSDARLLPTVHRLEAAELAWYGAKILHPRALVPLTGTRIPVHIRPFADPESFGTTISTAHDAASTPVRGLSAVRQHTLLTVSGSGVIGVPGIATRMFAALHSNNIPVSLVAQASAEAALDCTVPTEYASTAVSVLRDSFRPDIQRGEIDGVERRDGIAIVAVVGLAMARNTGVAARVFDALADGDINVVAIAQGAGERNISIALDEGDASAALRHIHHSFQLGKVGGGRPLRRTGRDIILLGAGTIGQTVMRLLAEDPECFTRLRIVAVVDRTGAYINLLGFTPEELTAIAVLKRERLPLKSLPGALSQAPETTLNGLFDQALVRPILVDMTASNTGNMLRSAANAGWDLVLANKQPLAAPTAELDALHESLDRNHAKLRYEATVGAGLPVVEALQQLLATGDKVRSLEGCLSGTLGVVLTALQDGISFSVAVENARARGFTEPDPRDDLGGLDVARKALILARTLGVRHELSQIKIDSMVLSGHDLAVDPWMKALPASDSIWRRRAEQAHTNGCVLRYVARITPNDLEVGLKEIPVAHPLAQLRGAANQLVFTSDRYHDSPLVITGPGAGPEVTATGVLADLLALS